MLYMETITFKDLLKPNTIWEYQNKDERAKILNECAMAGFDRIKDEQDNKYPLNAVLVLNNKTILETSILKHTKDIKHTDTLAYHRVRDHY